MRCSTMQMSFIGTYMSHEICSSARVKKNADVFWLCVASDAQRQGELLLFKVYFLDIYP